MSDEGDDGESTVGRAASRLGVTARTLHHWDEIALVRPSSRSAAGYRLYTDADIERLRRVVVYRELGLGLEAIRHLLDDPDSDVVTALRAQQAQVAERVRHLSELSDDLGRMIEAHERGVLLDETEQRTMFGPDWDPQWPVEARRRYGGTVEWQQYAERAASRTAADWSALADASAAFDAELAAAMDSGVTPGSPEAHALADRHREVFSAYFPLTRERQVLIGRLFEGDPAYAAHYDGLRSGLASWLRRCIDASAAAHGVDPDAASW